MLDQNTDRMWFVIGALVVGAGIILLANKMLPEIFANVTGSMENLVKQTESIGRKKYLTNADVTPLSSYKNFKYDGDTWSMTALQGTPTWDLVGLKHNADVMTIPYGYVGEIGYDVWIPEGYEGIGTGVDINTYPAKGDYWWINDNDYFELRTVNGKSNISNKKAGARVELVPGQWNSIVTTFENTDPENIDQVDLYSRSNIGLFRDDASVAAYAEVPVKFRNVYVDVYEK